MKIPVSDAILDGEADETLSVPLSAEQLAWVEHKASARGISKRQFVRYILNKVRIAEKKVQRNGKSESSAADGSNLNPQTPRMGNGCTPAPNDSDEESKSKETMEKIPDEDLGRSMFDFYQNE